MKKLLPALILLLCSAMLSHAQMVIGTVDPGPYTPGSTIAATFSIGTTKCIGIGNRFELYLSDANGIFSPTATPIGFYDGFYSTFVNGVIPTGTPAGAGYKLRIKSSNPNDFSTESSPFAIVAGTAVKAALTSTQPATINANPLTFGSCNTDSSNPNTSFRFTNASSTGTVSATVNNELNSGTPGAMNFTNVGDIQTFNAGLAHYTIFVKATANGTTATQAYFLINNLAVTAFTTTSGNTVCYPTGFFAYLVDVTTDKGIKANFPGNTYKIDWGDGTTNEYTYCDISSNSGSVTHTFSKSSCGLTFTSGSKTIYNAFGINVGVKSPFCGDIGTNLSTTAIVITRPVNKFSFPAIACTGDNVTFTNESTAGQKPNTNTAGCSSNNVDYNWYVDGVLVAQFKPFSYNLVYKFTTKGKHKIKLTSSSDGNCQADDVEMEICVQDPPKPSFTLDKTTICVTPGTLTPANTSVIDNTCNATPVYTWSVTPSANVTYANGTSSGSAVPQFKFNKQGTYNITLSIQTGTCEVTTLPQEVIVNAEPTASLSGPANLCVNGNYTFGPASTDTKTTVSGTEKELSDTYTWTLSGDATFVAPSTANSKYPVINFPSYTSYTVTLTHKNTCNTVSATQQLTFSQSPVPKITVDPSTVCYDANINLEGTVTNGTYTSFKWIGNGGTFSDPDKLKTTYTPTNAERDAGTTTITLQLSTGLTGACAKVEDKATVLFYPKNTGNNPAGSTAQNICTGSKASFTPSSTVPGSTFSWTAANADGNATGFSPSGNGIINETLTNTNATADAVVVYTITPTANGCNGPTFTFTVTIKPLPVLSAKAAKETICSKESAAIALSSNLSPTKYTWTSTASAGISGNTNQPVALTISSIEDILLNSGTTQGTVTYVITPVSASGCTGEAVTLTVKVDPAVTTANAGLDESICDADNYTLKGNTPVVGTGEWTLTSTQTGVVFADKTLATTKVSGLKSGEIYTFKWTISATGACAASVDEVSITVNVPTVPGTTAGDATVCYGKNSGDVKLTGNTGTVLRWESSTDNGVTWLPVSNTTTTLSYSNLLASTLYRAVVQNGSCTMMFSTPSTITVNPATTIADAGKAQILCAAPSTKLDANVPATTESGKWTMVSGDPNVVFTDATDPKTTVTALKAGTNYVFKWTITGSSVCDPSSAELSVKNLPPLNNVISSTSTEVCNGQVISIKGEQQSGGDGSYTYSWESSKDGISWTPISGESGQDLSFSLTETLSFRRTIVSSSCTLISNIIQVIAQPPITKNDITADQTICSGLVPAALNGSVPEGSDGKFNFQWQSSTDGSTWTDISGAVFQNYSPAALTVTTWYRRTVSTIACNGALKNNSNTVKITVNPNAKAEYTYDKDKACTPFKIDAQNLKTVPYPDRNASYTWYADDVQIGTGAVFPGYTITASNTTVVIKLVTTSKLGCKDDEYSHSFSTVQEVVPSFTQSTAKGCGPLLVNFVNTSSSLTGATFKWDFGNGTTSSQTMPSAVTFLPDVTGKDTTYTITLTATTSCGSSSVTAEVFVKAKPRSVFSPSKTVGCSPMKVTFSNTSPGGTNTYYYDFGDGTPPLTKTDKSSVEHTYITTVVKDFVVKMVAENECGRDESSYVIRVSPNTVLPELVVNANEKEGCAPFKVNFYNNSKGANSFKYDFGDGSTMLTRSAPEMVTHTFDKAGTFTVTLTASNGCSDTTTTETIKVLPQPVMDFSADVVLGCPGLVVQFKNTSVDGVAYLWDFGDGTTSNEFEPKHIYSGDQEYYTVTLSATNALGCSNTLIKNQYIHIVQPPVARFNVVPSTVISIPNYTFRFEDESTNSPSIWQWDFGDKIQSALKNPSHTYADTGTYVVTLRVMNQQGCFTTTFKKVTIVGVPGYLFVPNSFMPGSETPELREFKAKGSGIKTWRMSIFNKWGQTLWETTKLDEGRPVEGWDGTVNGTPAPQGVYFWKIDVELINGTEWKGMTYDSSAPKKTGAIHLIR
ncbi:PKD domain-containing protein [Pedobacter nutrimenti]|uniref:PKD repeat protein n=1 Tax=Pedobacter nutrimenti TaxID=1241337 RepID=A0A318UKX3_9SPHI|nr:PKD domain-containing protein [Pedobacter nutrimenti]PYF76027.1 PKD repeat protein [Pedobacter nutrimenti]